MLASKIGLMGGGGKRVIISSNQSKYNLRTAMGSPSGPQRIEVIINSGVEITSDDATVPAFDEGSGWASGTVITIVNNGKIYGMGGAGGNSATINNASTVVAGTNGQAGGVAMALRAITFINNGAGEIFGGGGGGGAGQGTYLVDSFNYTATGGGGGGGRGGATSAAGSAGTSNLPNTPPDQIRVGTGGATGSQSSFGTGGSGGTYDGGDRAGNGSSGGDWGASGSNGGTAVNTSGFAVAAATSGGAGGNAVALNGNSITWLAGNTGARVKGAVS